MANKVTIGTIGSLPLKADSALSYSAGKVRVALIGAGNMANQAHYPSLKEFDDVELVALCDLNPEKLQATAAKFGIPKTYQDYRKMLDETRPQAVYALMPPHQLFDVAMDIVDRGIDIFIEKPPAITSFQTENLARLAVRRNIISAVGFQRRFHPLFQRCYQEVLRHGRLTQLVVNYYKNVTPTEEHPYYRGAIDILTSDVIHAVDALRYYSGGNVVSVTSDIRKLDCWYDCCFNAIICFDNDVTGLLSTNWRSGARKFSMEFHALGCCAYANADKDAEIYVDNGAEPSRTLTNYGVADSESEHIRQGFSAMARAFIDAVKSRCLPHNNLTDAVNTMKIVDAICANRLDRNKVGAYK